MRPPPREITELITFPEQPPEEINLQKVLNRVHHQAYMRRKKQEKKGIPNIIYKNGEKILIKNRQQPSSTKGIAKKLLLIYVGPFVIKKDNGNNTYTYVIGYLNNNKIKGTYNKSEIKKFYNEHCKLIVTVIFNKLLLIKIIMFWW